MKKDSMEYYLGLDMGTNSVGWAVTDTNYKLLRLKGKDAWGIREFDEAKTSEDRRVNRISRRRREREKVRIGLVKDYFSDAIHAVDPNFFMRLENSKYYLEDKDEDVKTPNAIFDDPDYTDKDYYDAYPTIFHLRKELIEDKKPHDVRLVYLAVLNMFKHRGHFLNSGLSTDSDNNIKIDGAWEDLNKTYEELYGEELAVVNCDELLSVLSDRDKSRSAKLEQLLEILQINKKTDKQKAELIRLICGLKSEAKKVFSDIETEEKVEICFTDIAYEEKLPDIAEAVGEENIALIQAAKTVSDIGVLAGILHGDDYLSFARVKTYEKHAEDLKRLKRVIRKYGDEAQYDSLFRSEEDGSYGAYVNSFNAGKKQRRSFKKRTMDEFYKTVKTVLSKLKGASDDPDYQIIEKDIENETFMPKQLTSANGIIPNQVHCRELKVILKNAEGYLPFLLEKDEGGRTVTDRICALFSFQIPYYIGPVSEQSEKNGGNGWVVRKEQGQVLPWNLEEKIDTAATSQRFIERMVRRCTYISDEMVLPKASLEYERFMVLNEINNLRIDGEKIPVSLKQEIYHELYEKGKRVTRKQLVSYLTNRGCIENEEQVSGIDITLHQYLSSYGKFYPIFGDDMKTDACKSMVEEIIRLATIFGDAKHLLRKQITEKYGDRISDPKILKRILGFKFKDWGNLSKRFLELEGCENGVGEIVPLIDMMWQTEFNMMELLNSPRFTYRQTLEEYQQKGLKPLTEWKAEDLNDYYFSAPVKRMVWQTLKIIKEIEMITGSAPKRVFVEMTRKPGEKDKRTDSRKKKFLELYKNIVDEDADWRKHWEGVISKADEDGSIRSKKMYLYLTQMGRCMYTGREIDLNDLFDDNLYDIDHIYARHYVKDDNIANNLVLVYKPENARKTDNYPIDSDIRSKMSGYWSLLHRRKLITDEKYRRLTGRNPFTDEQKADFIARQLVETSQATKGVTEIIKGVFPPEQTTIVYAKASNVSDFRHKYQIHKSRLVNDFHHAHDAYLNIVVGNVYYVKFTQNPLNFIKKEYAMDQEKHRYNLEKMFVWDVKRGDEIAWIGNGKDDKNTQGSLVTVKKMLAKQTPILSRMPITGHGGIANATLYSAKTAKDTGYMPLKTSDPKMQDVTKYGGYSTISRAYFFLVESGTEKKRIRTLETVPVYLVEKLQTKEVLEEYCRNQLKLINPSVRVSKIRLQSLINLNGYYVQMTGVTGKQVILRNAVSLVLNDDEMFYAKKIEKADNGSFEENVITKEKNVAFYDALARKHMETIYSLRPNPVGQKLEKARDLFVELSIEKQCAVLYQILNLSIIGPVKADLTLIGESKNTGVMLTSKNITKNKTFELINQSVTGLFEERVDLLTV